MSICTLTVPRSWLSFRGSRWSNRHDCVGSRLPARRQHHTLNVGRDGRHHLLGVDAHDAPRADRGALHGVLFTVANEQTARIVVLL